MNLKSFLIVAFAAITPCLSAQNLKDLISSGNTKLAASDPKGAEADFAKAIKLNQKTVDPYLDKLKKYNALDEYSRSNSDMPNGFLYNHDLAVPYFLHGMAFNAMGKQTEALAEFDKAITIDAKYPEALCERAIILIAQGNKEKACLDLLNAKNNGSAKAKTLFESNACKDNAGAFVTAGNKKYDEKDYEGAIKEYKNAVLLDPSLVDIVIKIGECFAYQKQNDKAIAWYNKALKKSPDNTQALYQRALIYNSTENFKEAFADLSVVITKNPDDYDAHMQRGLSCEGLTDMPSAILDYTEAIRIKPKEGMPYYKRGLANSTGKNKKVCKDFKMAASLGIEDAKPLAEGCDK